MSKENKKCCMCKDDVAGFVAHTDSKGDYCEDCTFLITCEECGIIEDRILDGGLCDSCEAEQGEQTT